MSGHSSLANGIRGLAVSLALCWGTIGYAEMSRVSANLWSDERASLIQLKSLLAAKPVLDDGQDVRQESILTSRCSHFMVPSEELMKECPRYYYEQVDSSGGPLFIKSVKSYLRKQRVYSLGEDWKNYFFLAATLVRLGEVELAAELISDAKEIHGKKGDGNKWIVQRLTLYRELLQSLKTSQNIASEVSPLRLAMHQFSDDPLTKEIASRMSSISNGESIAANIDTDKLTHQDALRQLNYEKWRVEQEIDEVQVLLANVRDQNLKFDTLARTNLIAERYGVRSQEWDAVVKMASRIGNRAELLARSRAMESFLDSWMSEHLSRKVADLTSGDDLVVRTDLVSQNLIGILKKIANKIRNSSLEASVDERLGVVMERLDAMQSTMHQFVDSVSLDAEVMVLRDLIAASIRCRAAMLRIQARLTSFEETVIKDEESFQQIKALRLDLQKIKRQYVDLAQLVTVRLHADDPISRSRLRRTKRRLKWLNVSAADLELIDSSSKQKIGPHIFNEIRSFMTEIEKKITASQQRKSIESEFFLRRIEPDKREMELLLKDTQDFFEHSEKELNSVVFVVLKKIETVLKSERENYDLLIAQRKLLIQKELSESADKIESEIINLNNIERMQRDNLEWRLSR